MPDVDLDLLVPEPIVLRTRRDGPVLATLPGEIGVTRMLEITRAREEGAKHERQLLDLPDTDENREARGEASAGVVRFYEQAAEIIADVATLEPGVERLELTATQIVAVCSMLIAPQQRMQLLATAYLMAVGVEFDEEGRPVPLDEGSDASSSRSGDSEGGKRATGTRSRGASGSRTATPRKRKPRPSSPSSG